MNISNAVDKAHEGKSLKELLNSPVHALQGVTPKDAELLAQALNINTIGDLAKNKFFRNAAAIATLAETEN